MSVDVGCPNFPRYFISLLVFYSIFSLSCGKLYSERDSIVLLENDTIGNVLYDSPVAWLVEFYSSWCGHCHAFAPTYKKLADITQDWRPLIQVAALDCAEERNLDTCRQYEIDAYPTIRIFNASMTDRKNYGKTFDGEKTLLNLLHEAVKTVEMQINLQNNIIPDFMPATEDYISRFEKGQLSDVKALALVFEVTTSWIGKEVALDMVKYPSIVVKRIFAHQKSLIRQFGVSEFPTLVILHSSHGKLKRLPQKITNKSTPHATFKVALEKLSLPAVAYVSLREVTVAMERYAELHPKNNKKRHAKRVSEVFMTDLESALAYIMRREVLNKKSIKGPALDALINFTDLLAKCFPGKQTITNFLNRLHSSLSSATKLSKERKIDSRQCMRIIQRSEEPSDCFLPKDIHWHCCMGSKPQFRGYPCALWTLFHTLTVGCSKHQRVGKDGKRIQAQNVLKYIRDYVRYFFGCEECREHFYEMAKNVEDEVTDYDRAILWLWNGHNSVNRRLAKDKSEDPEHPKIPFPDDDMCEDCSYARNVEHVAWNNEVILQFMKNHYGVDNIRIKEHDVSFPPELEDVDVVRKTSRPVLVKMWSTIGMNSVDASMCLVLYTAIAVLFIGLYIYFIRKRRRGFLKMRVHAP